MKSPATTQKNKTNTFAIFSGLLFGGIILYFVATTGVFGGTQVALTLFTNPDLENGLVAHWTFDSDTTNVGTATPQVADQSGTGHTGYFVIEPSPGSEVAIDTAVTTSDGLDRNTSPTMVWINDQEGFRFWIDQTSNGAFMASTTDGGSTWGNAQNIDDPYGLDTFKMVVWYDQWTPGDTSGNLIHVAFLDGGTIQDLFYRSYNTVTNTLSDMATGTTQAATIGTNNFHSITKAEDGTIYMTAADGSDSFTVACSTTCSTSANWSEVAQGYTGTDADFPILMPLKDSDNVVMVVWDRSADNVYSNVYSATSSSWWGSNTIASSIEDNASYYGGAMSATMDKLSGEIFFSIIDDADDFSTQDHDIRVFRFNSGDYAWTELTSPITGASGGLTETSIALDENRPNHLYVAYGRRSTIGTNTTGAVYYKVSLDGGSTWSAESSARSSEDNIHGVSLNPMSNERIGITWKYAALDDIYYETLSDLGEYPDTKVVSGKLGQGISLDGTNDYVATAGSSFTSITGYPFTMAAWIRGDDDSAGTAEVAVSFGKSSTEYYAIGFTGDQSGSLAPGLIGRNTSYDEHLGPYNTLPGEWVHVTGVFKSATERELYINGEYDSEDTSSVTEFSDETALLVGTNDGSALMFDGDIDDVRVYDRELSPEEISRLYGLGATTKIGKTITTNPDLENGLLAHWSFDGEHIDTSSTTAEILDLSGNGHNGDWREHATTTTSGKIGQGIRLDGTDDHVAIPTLTFDPSTSDFTFSAWAKADTFSSPLRYVFQQAAAQGRTWLEFEGDGDIISFLGNNTRQSGVRAELNRWYHIVIVHNNSANELTWYVDGIEENTNTGVPVESADQLYYIGSDKVAGNNFFDGDLDDIRLYDRALSAEEIQRLYGLGATTKVAKTLITNPDLENGLVAHYTFDGLDVDNSTSTAEITDRSGTGNTGDWLNHATTTTSGKIGQAVDFDGSNDFISIPDNSSLDYNTFSAATWSVWIRPDVLTAEQGDDMSFLSHYNSSSAARTFLLFVDSPTDGITANANSNNGEAFYTTPVVPGQWYHVVAVWSASNYLRLYINGELIDEDGSVEATLDGNSNDHYIGARELSSTDEYFNGAIDDVRIYNRALSSEEVSRLYQLGN